MLSLSWWDYLIAPAVLMWLAVQDVYALALMWLWHPY